MSTRRLAENHAKFADFLPEDKTERTARLKWHAQQAAQREGKGAPTIKREFDARWPQVPIPSERTISDWIKGIRSGRTDSPEWNSWDDDPITDDLGFLLRLNLVKKTDLVYMMIDQTGIGFLPRPLPGLTVEEARVAVKLQVALQTIDPLIQLLIVHEYAERLAFAERSTQDLDLLIACRPWLDWRLYEQALHSGVAPPAEVRGLHTYRQLEERDPRIRVQLWSWSQLSVPWAMVLDGLRPDSPKKSVHRIEHRDLTTDQQEQLARDASEFNWEWLLLNSDRLLNEAAAVWDAELKATKKEE